MTKYVAAVLISVASSVGAHAPDGPRPAPGEKKICRYETPTGSYFGAKICKTRKDWVSHDRAVDDELDRKRRDTSIESDQGPLTRIGS